MGAMAMIHSVIFIMIEVIEEKKIKTGKASSPTIAMAMPITYWNV